MHLPHRFTSSVPKTQLWNASRNECNRVVVVGESREGLHDVPAVCVFEQAEALAVDDERELGEVEDPDLFGAAARDVGAKVARDFERAGVVVGKEGKGFREEFDRQHRDLLVRGVRLKTNEAGVLASVFGGV